ncbi:MAG TPA: MarR family transcriptional regulator [Polyangiaceae bacterium]|jgi:DNA-binding MarR family transcriptional regulator|nr:MarR family transcriptional regulator [Polyangiaceae bacterium]
MRDQFDGDQIVLENALPFLLHGAYQRIRSVTYREFNQYGLDVTPEQWIVLVRLWQKDGRTVSELSDSTLRDRPTMSRILDSMEAHGLLTRTVDSNDARTRIIQLTREGRALRKKLVPVAKAIVARLEAGIPESDLLTTRRTLRRMLENLA